ncbi:MAG: hypothetical protein HOP28_18275 [Gemmatimonadales bacterium]|nr:hypothetical protein [Gemmatimonadales bacterium]
MRISPIRSFRLRLQPRSPDQWFALGFILLLVGFFFTLLLSPSGVGRGGR